MFCPNCGREVDQNYCSFCGTRVVEPSPVLIRPVGVKIQMSATERRISLGTGIASIVMTGVGIPVVFSLYGTLWAVGYEPWFFTLSCFLFVFSFIACGLSLRTEFKGLKIPSFIISIFLMFTTMILIFITY